MKDKPTKITTTLKVIVTGEFYDDDVTEELLRYAVEQDLEDAGFEVDVSMIKEQDAEWIYGEDKTGVDGWRCSECNFFEPWFYELDDDIDFIKRYEHCPKCGRRMISYTGKQKVGD